MRDFLVSRNLLQNRSLQIAQSITHPIKSGKFYSVWRQKKPILTIYWT